MSEPHLAPAGTRVGYVHLKAADLNRTVGFYSDILGFSVMQRMDDQAAFLSAGGYRHHIGLNKWESAGATPPLLGHTGLYHSAFLYPRPRGTRCRSTPYSGRGNQLGGCGRSWRIRGDLSQ